MKLFENCLIACDVDGTLVYNGTINEKNIKKIRFFVKNGGIFALATGRSVGALNGVISKIPEISVSVVSNGCMIYNYQTKEILYEKKVVVADNAVIYEVYDKHPDIGIELHEGTKVLVLRKTNETEDHENYELLEREYISKDNLKNRKFNKVLYALNGEEQRPIIRKTVEAVNKNSMFIDTAAILYGRERAYLEQIPKDISKASGVKILAEMLEIKKGGLFAIGDYYNDFEMLNLADVAAAPAHSPKEIKEISDYITVDAKDGAVADFIDYLTDLRRK